jgi:hypothetical protein
MVLDQALMFADGQVLTTSAMSQNIIDLGPLTGGTGVNPIRDIGTGECLWIFVSIGAQDVAPGTATIAINLETDSDVAFGSPIGLGTVMAIAAGAKAGALFVARLQPANYERYLRVSFAVTGGPLTQGTFSSGIVWDEQSWRAYASGFSTGVQTVPPLP